MFENLKEIKNRYNELDSLLGDPAVIADREKWQKLVKEHSSYTVIVELYDEFLKLEDKNKIFEEKVSVDLAIRGELENL